MLPYIRKMYYLKMLVDSVATLLISEDADLRMYTHTV